MSVSDLHESALRVSRLAETMAGQQIRFLADLIRIRSYTGQERVAPQWASRHPTARLPAGGAVRPYRAGPGQPDQAPQSRGVLRCFRSCIFLKRLDPAHGSSRIHPCETGVDQMPIHFAHPVAVHVTILSMPCGVFAARQITCPTEVPYATRYHQPARPRDPGTASRRPRDRSLDCRAPRDQHRAEADQTSAGSPQDRFDR